jgi:16S rRNA G966 N2-methylase RsmD
VAETLILPGMSRLIAEAGVLVFEHSFREDILETDILSQVDQRRYGDTVLSFFKLSG